MEFDAKHGAKMKMWKANSNVFDTNCKVEETHDKTS